MTDTPQEAGAKTLVATVPTGVGEHRIYVPNKGVTEVFCDGVAGILVNSLVVKLDLYSSEVDYDPERRGIVRIEHRVVNQRVIIPVPNLLDFFAGFINGIDLNLMDDGRGKLKAKLQAIAQAATAKAQTNE